VINCTFLLSDSGSYNNNKILPYTCSLVCAVKVNISSVNISPGLRGFSLFLIIQTLAKLYNLLKNTAGFDVLLTVHLSIILVFNQLNAQNLVL